MANRRMFSKLILSEDGFLDLSLSAQAVYMHLAVRADDDGFLGNPRCILRMMGAIPDVLGELARSGYIREFDSGAVYITHWRHHNYIKKDRYTPTIYKEERKLVYGDDTADNSNTDAASDSEDSTTVNTQEDIAVNSDKDAMANGDKATPTQEEKNTDSDRVIITADFTAKKNGSTLEPQDRLGKDRLGKDRSGKYSSDKDSTHKDSTAEDYALCVGDWDNYPDEIMSCEHNSVSNRQGAQLCDEVVELFNNICSSLSKVQSVTDSRRAKITELLGKYTMGDIETVFSKVPRCDFLCGGGAGGWKASFDWLIREENFLKVLEGNYDRSPRAPSDSSSASYDIDEYERYSIFD